MKEILIIFFLLFSFDLADAEITPGQLKVNIQYIPDLIKGLEETDNICSENIRNLTKNDTIINSLVKLLNNKTTINEFIEENFSKLTPVLLNCHVLELIKTLSHYALEKDGIYDLGVNMEKNALIISKSSKLFMSREKDWTKKFVNLGKVIKYVFNITYFK